LSEITEKSWLNPSSVYGATKAAGDALVNAYYLAHGVDMVTFRVAGGYGPGRVTPCLIRLLIEDALEGRESLVCEDSKRTRQYIFVDDVVDAVVQAMDQPKLPQRTYNIGPGVLHTARDVINAVQACLPDAKAEINPAGMRWNSFGIGLLNIDAARRDFGFKPKTDLVQGVQKTLEWVLKRQSQR
jgi:UDP-glucose 4-epimerase